jgi:hypothetical protein
MSAIPSIADLILEAKAQIQRLMEHWRTTMSFPLGHLRELYPLAEALEQRLSDDPAFRWALTQPVTNSSSRPQNQPLPQVWVRFRTAVHTMRHWMSHESSDPNDPPGHDPDDLRDLMYRLSALLNALPEGFPFQGVQEPCLSLPNDDHQAATSIGDLLARMRASLPLEPTPYRVQRHGQGWAIYRGRSFEHHGWNLGQLSESTEALAQQIETGLNLHHHLAVEAARQGLDQRAPHASVTHDPTSPNRMTASITHAGTPQQSVDPVVRLLQHWQTSLEQALAVLPTDLTDTGVHRTLDSLKRVLASPTPPFV